MHLAFHDWVPWVVLPIVKASHIPTSSAVTGPVQLPCLHTCCYVCVLYSFRLLGFYGFMLLLISICSAALFTFMMPCTYHCYLHPNLFILSKESLYPWRDDCSSSPDPLPPAIQVSTFWVYEFAYSSFLLWVGLKNLYLSVHAFFQKAIGYSRSIHSAAYWAIWVLLMAE